MAKRFTPEQVDRMCDLYRTGHSIRMVAAKFGASYGGVHHLLWSNGVQVRGRKDAARLMADRLLAAKRTAS